MSVCPSVCQSVCPSICPSVYYYYISTLLSTLILYIFRLFYVALSICTAVSTHWDVAKSQSYYLQGLYILSISDSMFLYCINIPRVMLPKGSLESCNGIYSCRVLYSRYNLGICHDLVELLGFGGGPPRVLQLTGSLMGTPPSESARHQLLGVTNSRGAPKFSVSL